ncbi:hypothetical protein [Streptomyces sp. cmx-10-25]|uniref:hypothetical protein n=1 Tax=Streptomyces sp. cmx-10-25 TaxID=2790919 RepID=UPI00397F2531
MKLTTRHLFRGQGHHRAPALPARIEVPLDDILGGWPTPTRERVALGTQAWRDCPPCHETTSGIVDADGFTCGQCLTTTPAEVTQ